MIDSYPTVYYVKPELKFEEIILKHYPRSKGYVKEPGIPALTASEYFKREPQVLAGVSRSVMLEALKEELRERFHYDEIYVPVVRSEMPGIWTFHVTIIVVGDIYFLDFENVSLAPSTYRRSLGQVERKIRRELPDEVLSDIEAIYKIACLSLKQEALIRGLSYDGINIRAGMSNGQYVSVYFTDSWRTHSAVKALRLLHDGTVSNLNEREI